MRNFAALVAVLGLVGPACADLDEVGEEELTAPADESARGSVEPGLIGEVMVGEQGPGGGHGLLRAAADPADSSTNGWCYGNYVWNGTRARLYWPSNGGCGGSQYSPMVVILPGNGYEHTRYHYLARHLTRNRHIVAVIDEVSSSDDSAAAHQAAADEAWDFVVDFMWSHWNKRFFIDPSRVGLIGHSRGGETARYLADDLRNDALFDVRAVVGLAPTGDLDSFINGYDADAAMFLYGSNDVDVSPDQVYRHFDRAGSTGSQRDPWVNNLAMYRSMKLLDNATHAGFAQSSTNIDPGAPQRDTTEGYVLAFLKAHLADDFTWYEDFVRGDQVPGDFGGAVYSQYRDGYLRRVIDNFSDSNTSASYIGGLIVPHQASAVEIHTDSYTNIPHQDRGMFITSIADGGSVSFTIPAGEGDMDDFRYLSLRIASRDPAVPDDVFVQIRNGNQDSPLVRLSDFGQIAPQVEMCVAGVLGQYCGQTDELTHLSTVRVPLAFFGAHDDVVNVRLVFGADALYHPFLIDDLEVSQSIFGP